MNRLLIVLLLAGLCSCENDADLYIDDVRDSLSARLQKGEDTVRSVLELSRVDSVLTLSMELGHAGHDSVGWLYCKKDASGGYLNPVVLVEGLRIGSADSKIIRYAADVRYAMFCKEGVGKNQALLELINRNVRVGDGQAWGEQVLLTKWAMKKELARNFMLMNAGLGDFVAAVALSCPVECREFSEKVVAGSLNCDVVLCGRKERFDAVFNARAIWSPLLLL